MGCGCDNDNSGKLQPQNTHKGVNGSDTKGWFSYVGKFPDDLGFHCFPTYPDFAE